MILADKEKKTLRTMINKLARFEKEDVLGAILKNNSGRLSTDEVIQFRNKITGEGS